MCRGPVASASGSVRVRPTALQKRSGGTPGLVAAAPSRCQTLSGGSCTILALHPSQSCCAWGVAKVARGPGIWEQPGSALPSPAPPHHKPLCGGGVQEAPWRVLWRRPIWSERTRFDPRASRREPASRPAFSGQKSQPSSFFYPWGTSRKKQRIAALIFLLF